MSLGVVGILDRVVSHGLATGLFERVNGHEPASAPGSGLSCAVWVDSMDVERTSGLAVASARLILKVRIFAPMTSEPLDEIDPAVLNAVDVLWAAYIGGFTLGGLVRNVDVLGMSGVRLSAQAGYVDTPAGGPRMRVMTITLPLLVNDVWTEAP